MVLILELTLVRSCLHRTIGHRFPIEVIPFIKLVLPQETNKFIWQKYLERLFTQPGEAPVTVTYWPGFQYELASTWR